MLSGITSVTRSMSRALTPFSPLVCARVFAWLMSLEGLGQNQEIEARAEVGMVFPILRNNGRVDAHSLTKRT